MVKHESRSVAVSLASGEDDVIEGVQQGYPRRHVDWWRRSAGAVARHNSR